MPPPSTRLLSCIALAMAPWASQAEPIVTAPGARVPVAAKRESPLAEKMRLGHEALAKQQLPTAEALFREAGALDPKSAQPWLGLAEAARVKGDAAGVKQYLGEALKVAPRDPATLSAWGRWYFANRDYAKAEEYWNSTLAADPRNARTLVDLGDLAFNVRNRPAEAADFYRRALAIDPALGGAHYALGMSLWRTGNPAQALPEFEESARLSPNNALPLHAMGRLHAEAGRADQALASFDRALAAQAGYYPARMDKADLLAAAGKTEQALTEVRTVLRAQPKLAAAHTQAGMLLQQLNRGPEAMASYQESIKLDPKQPVALNNLAWLASQRPDIPDRGLKWAQAAVELNREEPRFQGTLGWVLYKRGETAKALAILEPLVQAQGRTIADTHYLLGVVYAESGDKKKAAASLNEALRLDPKFANAADATARLRKLEGG